MNLLQNRKCKLAIGSISNIVTAGYVVESSIKPFTASY